jgi:TRAP-type C4-dicarboxylate transport system permease small subunit
LIKKFLNIITWVASILLGAVVLLMATQVFLRFAFNSPQAWAEEVDRYVFVWSIYLGTLIALIKGTHIRVTFLTDKMSEQNKNILELITNIINLFCFIIICFFGIQLAYDNRFSEFYTLTFMPQVLFYLSVPICFSLMIIFLIVNLSNKINNLIQN